MPERDATKLVTTACCWLSYMDTVIPKDAPPLQIQECKRAFYGGMIAFMEITKAIGAPTVSEDHGVEILARINTELMAFMTRIAAGQE